MAQMVSNENLFQSGIEALEAGHYDEAVKSLTSLVNATPDFYQPGMGSAAYWAGRALSAVGRPEQARMVWLLGLKRFEKAGHIDPRLSDAYIEFVFQEKRELEYARAVEIYLRLLERAFDLNDAEEQCIVKRHLSQILPLLALPDQARVSESRKPARCEAWQFTKDAGPYLAAWWRSRDPQLATERNERLEEHLGRVAEAGQNYEHKERVSKLDDRGEIFVRYGKPSRQVFLRSGAGPVDSGETIVFPEIGVPKGELWFYEHIDSEGYYFFVQEGRYFRIGQISDMADNYRGPGGRDRRNALLYQHYEKLAFMHPDFAARYTEMENLPNQVNAGSPGQMMRNLWYSTRAEEDLEVHERDKRMPVQYDESLSNTSNLPVALRSARFLDKDGTTRTEIYWSADLKLPKQEELSEALAALGSQTSLNAPHLQLTVAHQDAQHRTRAMLTEQYLAEDNNGVSALPAHTSVVRGDTGLYHVALQWEQLAAQVNGIESEGMTNGIRLRSTIERIDSLTALSSTENTLEMSDVVPVYAEALMSPSLYEDEHPNLQPFPFSKLTAQDSVGLFFEIYHLTFGADDQTHYSVEYEVIHKTTGRGLLRRKQEVRTTAQTPYAGNSRTARDAILLNLEEWVDGEVTVTVRVRDETSGDQVERSILFETTR